MGFVDLVDDVWKMFEQEPRPEAMLQDVPAQERYDTLKFSAGSAKEVILANYASRPVEADPIVAKKVTELPVAPVAESKIDVKLPADQAMLAFSADESERVAAIEAANRQVDAARPVSVNPLWEMPRDQ